MAQAVSFLKMGLQNQMLRITPFTHNSYSHTGTSHGERTGQEAHHLTRHILYQVYSMGEFCNHYLSLAGVKRAQIQRLIFQLRNTSGIAMQCSA